MKQDHQCKFCGKQFHQEKTLTTHMCVKKQRHMDANAAGPRIGFLTFQKFYVISTNAKKPKTLEEFINSQYYIDFVKFGNHLALLKPVHIDQYIEFVIKNGVKLKDWTKDSVYELYVEDLVKKEPAASATDRSIVEIIAWAEKNGSPFNHFFNDISANEAAYLIKTGKISPWVLYLSANGDHLMSCFTEDHAKMIGNVIDPGFWMKKFRKNPDDVNFIQSVLTEAGL